MNVSETKIHVVTSSNAGLLDCVDNDVFDHQVQPELLNAFLANSANLLVVAVIDGNVVGMASGIAYAHPDKPLQLFVKEVGVSPQFQRRGIGKELVKTLLQHGKQLGCQEAWMATETGNAAARGLYCGLGGKEDDEKAIVYTYALVEA